MTTELFTKLREQAWDREHPIVIKVQELWSAKAADGERSFTRDVPTLGRLARSLQALRLEITQEIDAIATSHGMRIHNWPVFCTQCHRESCPGAEIHNPTAYESPQAFMAMMLHHESQQGGT